MTIKEYMDALAEAKSRACKDYDPCHHDRCACKKCGESMEAHGYKWSEGGPVPATPADLAPGIPGFTLEQVRGVACRLEDEAHDRRLTAHHPVRVAAAMLRAAVGEP